MITAVTFSLPNLGGRGGRDLWRAALTANGRLDPPPDPEVASDHPLGLGPNPRLVGGQEVLGPIPHAAELGPGRGQRSEVSPTYLLRPGRGHGRGQRSSGTNRSWGGISESRMWVMGR